MKPTTRRVWLRRLHHLGTAAAAVAVVACGIFRALELSSKFHLFFAGLVSGVFLAAAYFATTESVPRDGP